MPGEKGGSTVADDGCSAPLDCVLYDKGHVTHSLSTGYAGVKSLRLNGVSSLALPMNDNYLAIESVSPDSGTCGIDRPLQPFPIHKHRKHRKTFEPSRWLLCTTLTSLTQT